MTLIWLSYYGSLPVHWLGQNFSEGPVIVEGIVRCQPRTGIHLPEAATAAAAAAAAAAANGDGLLRRKRGKGPRHRPLAARRRRCRRGAAAVGGEHRGPRVEERPRLARPG
jgi:hypothetical protein